MNVDQYYGEVRRLGLTPTKTPHVYLSAAGDCHSVPDPSGHTDAQRAETIERLKVLLGIGKRDE